MRSAAWPVPALRDPAGLPAAVEHVAESGPHASGVGSHDSVCAFGDGDRPLLVLPQGDAWHAQQSGCRIEDRRLGDAESLEACPAIDLVVAWRVMHLTKLGRETPEMPCSVFFEKAEWQALVCHQQRSPTPPDTPPTLGEAMRLMAKLGGSLGRTGDGDPGATVLCAA